MRTVELGVIIGKGGRDITAAQALDHVAGYVRTRHCFPKGSELVKLIPD